MMAIAVYGLSATNAVPMVGQSAPFTDRPRARARKAITARLLGLSGGAECVVASGAAV